MARTNRVRIDARRTGAAIRARLWGRARIGAVLLAFAALLVLASATPAAVLALLTVILTTGVVVGGAIALTDRRAHGRGAGRDRPSYRTADRLARHAAP
ncbi:hypothetical protein [Roseisolibacter sp. H3M3-2]|uniref:hypothetical protein n=1 Tax=Roseisolibacter sp. H3M3-2 TaxID=3031323 RepID=UPI0023D9D607|nr:hypothetical protein [Roseisolibacter sp. H3M3-2]MDF1501394.1 hypothetical protein [Roseisolibacter sp. H3M3-2]